VSAFFDIRVLVRGHIQNYISERLLVLITFNNFIRVRFVNQLEQLIKSNSKDKQRDVTYHHSTNKLGLTHAEDPLMDMFAIQSLFLQNIRFKVGHPF